MENTQANSRPASGPSRIVGFIDMGTNSIRLLLVRVNPNQSYTVLSQLKQTVRLGEGEFTDRKLQPQAMDRAALVLQTFADLARSYGADEITAVATAATREAENHAEFVERLWQQAKLDIRVVSGKEEARLIYLGASSALHLGDKQTFFIDIGGGSTEIIVGDQHKHHYLDSLKLGAVRLGSLFPASQKGLVTPPQYEQIQRYIRHYALPTTLRVQKYRIDLAFGSSGTIENLADIAARAFSSKRPQPDTLRHIHLRNVIKMLCALPLDKRKQVPGLNPERADIIIAGAAILDTFMEELDLSQIGVTDRGLRDGLLVDYLLKEGHTSFMGEMSVRERSVFQLGRACNFDEAHGSTTSRLALELFDSARALQMHELDDWERELLYYAALLHDIGAFLTYSDHHVHTYYLIRNADLLGFDLTELSIIAATAFYHRKAFPRKKHAQFAQLDKRSKEVVQVLCVLLRIAENLDRAHAGRVHRARFHLEPSGPAFLTLNADHDCQVEIWGVQNHANAFEKVFGRGLDVRVRRAAELPN